jgi:thymidylate synthase (FAD)
MKLIEPGYEILTDIKSTNFTKQIEIAARTCYKSEGNIEEGSDIKLLKKLLKRNHEAMIEHAPNISVKFTANRGFTHEIVRMRLASFGQESTRYVNYSKDKHGAEINVCLPDYIKNLGKEAQAIFELSWIKSQNDYLNLVNNHKVPAQIARDVLPIGVKADIVVTSNVRHWRHMLKLRTEDVAHPIMHELMRPLLKEFQEAIPILFDDITY